MKGVAPSHRSDYIPIVIRSHSKESSFMKNGVRRKPSRTIILLRIFWKRATRDVFLAVLDIRLRSHLAKVIGKSTVKISQSS